MNAQGVGECVDHMITCPADEDDLTLIDEAVVIDPLFRREKSIYYLICDLIVFTVRSSAGCSLNTPSL